MTTNDADKQTSMSAKEIGRWVGHNAFGEKKAKSSNPPPASLHVSPLSPENHIHVVGPTRCLHNAHPGIPAHAFVEKKKRTQCAPEEFLNMRFWTRRKHPDDEALLPCGEWTMKVHDVASKQQTTIDE